MKKNNPNQESNQNFWELGSRQGASQSIVARLVGGQSLNIMVRERLAVLGATVVAPSFDGPIKVRIPPATNPGKQLRVRGHGLPIAGGNERGDLYIVANINVPPRLTDQEKTLWTVGANNISSQDPGRSP